MCKTLVNANRVDMAAGRHKGPNGLWAFEEKASLSLFPSIFLWLSSPSDFRPTTTANVVFPAEEIALSADKSEREIERVTHWMGRCTDDVCLNFGNLDPLLLVGTKSTQPPFLWSEIDQLPPPQCRSHMYMS